LLTPFVENQVPFSFRTSLDLEKCVSLPDTFYIMYERR
jgi:hypothetical protein